MPKRSNLFQRLILAIHYKLAGSATVAESQMLQDRATHHRREVDIVVETTIAESRILLSIECCDHTRPATVQWVEQICCKHADLPTDKLLLVSRSGFTKDALAKAHKHKAEALTFEEAEAVPWTTIVHRLHRMYVDAVDVRTLVFADDDASPNINVSLSHDIVICSSDGAWQPWIRQVVDAIVEQQDIRKRLIGALAEGQDGGWIVDFPVAEGTYVQDASGTRRSIDVLRVVVLTRRRRYRLDLQTGLFREYQVAFGESEGDLGTILLTVIEHEGNAPDALVLRQQDGHTEIVPLTGSRRRELNPAPAEAMRALLRRAV